MLPKEYSVEGKTVIITGAARGIGKGIARVLAESGAKVMVTSLTNQYLVPLSESMAADGHPIEILTADATKSEDWQRTYDYAMEKWGHVDALVDSMGLERPDHFQPRAVANVSEAGVFVSAEISLQDLLVPGPVKYRSPGLQFTDPLRGLLRMELGHAAIVDVLPAGAAGAEGVDAKV